MGKILAIMNKLDKIGLFFLTDLFSKSTYYVQVNGWGAWLKKILLLIVELFVKHREAVLFEKDLSEIPEPIHPKRGVKIKRGTHDDVPRLTRLLPQWSARIFGDRLSRGDIFFLAQIDQQVVHQTWISFKDPYVPLLNKRIVLRKGEAHLYHIYTAPELRGKNICTAVQRRVLRYLKTQGYQRCSFPVDLKEHPSTRMYEKFFGPIEGLSSPTGELWGIEVIAMSHTGESHEFWSHLSSLKPLEKPVADERGTRTATTKEASENH